MKIATASGILRFTIAFCLLYAALAFLGALFDDRLVNAEQVWLKPIKFGVSLTIYLGTVHWALTSLSPSWQAGKPAFLLSVALCLCTMLELAYIGLQAARAQPSHFNVATPFFAAMYSAMAIAAVVLVLAGGGFGILAILDKAADLSNPLRIGFFCAFSASTALTVLTALTMGSRLTHHAGVEAVGAARLPLAGWSLTVGDMRPPHFLATHLMQAGPLFACFISRAVNDRAASFAVAGFCLLWTALTVWVFRTVLAGKPFFKLLN